MTAEHTSSLQSFVSSSQTICVFFADHTSPDVVLSAVAFAQGLSSLGKSVTIASPSRPVQSLQQFDGVPEVGTELGNKNLDVSFPYREEQVDKVSYHIDEEAQRFHLVVQPKKGVKPLDSSQVEFALTGAEADLMILFGVNRLEQLEQLYFGYEELFSQANTVSIHTHDTPYGTLKINISGSASYAEVVAYTLQEMGAELNSEMSTNLLAAIEAATQTFKSLSVAPQTFEIAGRLLAAGARRVRLQADQQSGKTAQPSASFATALGKQPQKEYRSQSQSQQSQRDKDKQKSKQLQMPSQFGGVSRS
mgnify:CR=1 FL=1